MKKIVYVVTEDWYFWSHRLGLAEEAKNKGYEVFVLTREGAYSDKIEKKGFILIPISILRGFASPLRELQVIIQLVKQYKTIKPDLIHHIALKSILLGSIAALLARIPIVINSYMGMGYLFISNNFKTRFVRAFIVWLMAKILRTDKYNSIVQNSHDYKVLSELGLIDSSTTTLIQGSGVDTQVFDYSEEVSDNSKIILFASRLLADKGIYDFIAAARILREQDLPVRFIIVGDRDEENPTCIKEEEILTWVDEGIVEWWGYKENMHEVFAQVHIVCLPSYHEGFPKVLLEAASCGRPIITTNIPGCRDIVNDGLNGFLIPVKNPIRLAGAMEKLLSSSIVRSKMGLAGRKRVIDSFNSERINKQTIDLYNSLLEV